MTRYERGDVCRSKRELVDWLESWVCMGDDPTIGDVGRYGGKSWLRIMLGSTGCHLNADTTRAGVLEYLGRAHRAGADLKWLVVANNRGVVNKVVPDDGGPAIKGFYLYLDVPADAPVRI